MATITFIIPNNKLTSIVDAMKGLYSIPQRNTGTDENPVLVNDYTDNAWAKECIRRWIIKSVAKYNHKIAQEAIEFVEDDSLLA